MGSNLIPLDFATPRLKSHSAINRRQIVTEHVRSKETQRRFEQLQRAGRASMLPILQQPAPLQPLEYRSEQIPFAKPMPYQLVMLVAVLTIAIMSIITMWVY